MRNLKKSFLSLVLCFVVALFSGTTIFAQEIYNYDELDIVDAGETSEGVVANFSAEPVVDEEAEEEDSRSVSYVTNTLSGELIPGNDGVAVIFNNAGIDKISSVTFTISIYNYAGGYVASKTHTLRKLSVGETAYTWLIAKSASVYETIYLSGTGEDGGEKYIFSTSTVRYNFAGGRYGSMDALGGQRHHMPSTNALSSTGALSKNDGAALRMITSDHYQTASYGNTATAVAFRNKEITQINNGKFLAAQKLGIKDVQNLFGTKYDKAINQMVSYTKGLGFTK